MIPKPIALGLSFCESVIIEKGTDKLSLIGCFDDLQVEQFPSVPQKFWMVVPLAQGWNRGKIKLMVFHLETNTLGASREEWIHFPDRFQVVYFQMRFRRLRFPAAGRYLFTVWIDKELVAERTLHVFAS